ncbi:MAG TPA: ATP-binding protein [Xanthobacteraceae bacterium]|nr:ATP-binding protein [Xanthobacteraceae bacterium]
MAAYHLVLSTDLRSVFAAGIFVFAILFSITSLAGAGAEQRRRIYFLESLSPTQPAATRTIEGFKKRLSEKTTESFEIYIDYMELGRFSGQAHLDRTARFLTGKYAEGPPDVLITLGRAAVPFMLKYRDVIAPQVPIIIASVPARAAAEAKALVDAVYVVTEYNFAKTLELAQQLQPDARNLVLVGGASEYDRSWVNDARHELEPFSNRFKIQYVIGLPYDDMLREVSQLSRHTIVMMSFVFVDGAGQSRVPPDVAAAVANISAAPVYSPVSTFFGRGVIGGYMDSYEAQGIAAADLAVEILSGKAPAALHRETKPSHRYQVDARQLERWGLSSRNLPPQTAVSWQEPSLWEQHRNLVLAGILVFAVQTGLVGALLIHQRQRQRAEALLKESEERMTFTAASANVGMWQFNRETKDLWTTEHCRTMFGLANDDPLTGSMLLEAIHPEDREIAASSLRETLNPDKPAGADVRVVLPNDGVRWVRILARSNPDVGGALKQLSGIFVDISEQKAAETDAALQRNEVAHLMRASVLGQLSGAIAHEINQPLTAILSNAQGALHLLAQNSPDLAEVRDALQDIVDEDNRAGEVVHRLRNLLRKGERKIESVDVNDLVNSTIALLNSEFISRRISVKVDLANWLPATSGDPVQLQQVLLNLVINAMDAMASTPVAQRLVTISTRATRAGAVEVGVTDCGCGIRPVEQGRLFEPFYTTKSHGLGLGLTICSTIIHAHGGKLALTNDEVGGALAVFSLPAREMLFAAQ